MQTNQPDDATGDSVILERVHTFLAALLTFLGFKILPTDTVVMMLGGLTEWLEMAKVVRRDPQGATARIWWDAFKLAWQDDGSETAGKRADLAAAEFGKRFLPVNDDGRDTFDTADFEALRTECDKLEANIAILESRADDLQLSLDGIIAERDALLKANSHHASEIESVRKERDDARNWCDQHLDRVNALELNNVSLQKERDALKAQLASAIVPLPKPERVQMGQLWAYHSFVDRVQEFAEAAPLVAIDGKRISQDKMLQDPNWLLLVERTR